MRECIFLNDLRGVGDLSFLQMLHKVLHKDSSKIRLFFFLLPYLIIETDLMKRFIFILHIKYHKLLLG